jgi:UrcA family protein
MNAQTNPRAAQSNAVIATAWIVLSAIAPLLAFADPPLARTSSTLESRVALSDLDLATRQGIALAHKRLERKAEYLCHQLWDDDSMLRRTYEACVNETLESALQQLNMSILAATDPARTP